MGFQRQHGDKLLNPENSDLSTASQAMSKTAGSYALSSAKYRISIQKMPVLEADKVHPGRDEQPGAWPTAVLIQ
jgi:hypothetical protein